jgi:hypothetical protein
LRHKYISHKAGNTQNKKINQHKGVGRLLGGSELKLGGSELNLRGSELNPGRDNMKSEGIEYKHRRCEFHKRFRQIKNPPESLNIL